MTRSFEKKTIKSAFLKSEKRKIHILEHWRARGKNEYEIMCVACLNVIIINNDDDDDDDDGDDGNKPTVYRGGASY